MRAAAQALGISHACMHARVHKRMRPVACAESGCGLQLSSRDKHACMCSLPLPMPSPDAGSSTGFGYKPCTHAWVHKRMHGACAPLLVPSPDAVYGSSLRDRHACMHVLAPLPMLSPDAGSSTGFGFKPCMHAWVAHAPGLVLQPRHFLLPIRRTCSLHAAYSTQVLGWCQLAVCFPCCNMHLVKPCLPGLKTQCVSI